MLNCKLRETVPAVPLKLQGKLAILADAAKYDASCASCGTKSRNSLNGTGVGSTGGAGICHSYAPDGRCISLLKILLTNSARSIASTVSTGCPVMFRVHDFLSMRLSN